MRSPQTRRFSHGLAILLVFVSSVALAGNGAVEDEQLARPERDFTTEQALRIEGLVAAGHSEQELLGELALLMHARIDLESALSILESWHAMWDRAAAARVAGTVDPGIRELAGGNEQKLQRLNYRFGTLAAIGLDTQQILSTLTMTELIEQQANQAGQQSEAARQFMGFNFGIGFGVSVDIEGGDRIESAEVVDDTVRVSRRSDALPRIVLEAHHFLLHNGRTAGARDIDKATRGSGPFFALQTSGEEVIEGFGAGWMWGWRHKPTNSNSFNVAVGLILDRNVQVLGDGIEANQPLPGNETTVRFKHEDRLGALLFGSLSF